MKTLLILLSAVLTISCYAGSATLAWNAPTNSVVTGYKLYYGTRTNPTTQITLGNVTTAILNGLRYRQTYYFAVTAYNKTGESARSNQISYRIP